MKTLTIFSFCLLIFIFVQNVPAQETKICGGRKIDEKTTIVKTSRTIFVSQGGIINANALYLPKPKYPEQAKNLRGAVNVQVTIDERGNVISAFAVSGNKLLRNSAVKAARKAKFKKMLIDCKRRKYTGVIVYNFQPEKGK
jgi:TonB family protein